MSGSDAIWMNEETLLEALTRPRQVLVEFISRITSPLVVLGAGGKMGPSLCVLAKRAAELADHDLDMARIALAAAKSSYDGAVYEVTEAQREVQRRRIVAPFEARVQEIHVQAGETINGTLNAVKLITLRPLNPGK